jgi:hypothetical protein
MDIDTEYRYMIHVLMTPKKTGVAAHRQPSFGERCTG